MGTTKKSTKCKVCNRTVRYDSVTFPYCNYHAILKNSSSKIFVDSTQSNLAEAREIMYNPSRTIRSNTTETLFILSNDSKVKLKTVAQTFKKWRNKTKNLEIQIFGANNGLRLVGNGHEKAPAKLPGPYAAG